MSSFTTLIVDDEPLARKGLAVRLAELAPHFSIAQSCGNGRQAIEYLQQHSVDVMFLDIQMPQLDGFAVLEQLIEQNITPKAVVFVTAFDEYALKAFEVHAIDYLLKPVDDKRLQQCIERIENQFKQLSDTEHKQQLVNLVSNVTGTEQSAIISSLESGDSLKMEQYSDVLPIKDGSELARVPVKDIIWIDAAGDYMCVHTQERTHILRQTMKQLEQQLDPKRFIRSHRSVIVNKQYVEKFCNQINGEHVLVLTNGKNLKVSRSYKDKVKQAMTS